MLHDGINVSQCAGWVAVIQRFAGLSAKEMKKRIMKSIQLTMKQLKATDVFASRACSTPSKCPKFHNLAVAFSLFRTMIPKLTEWFISEECRDIRRGSGCFWHFHHFCGCRHPLWPPQENFKPSDDVTLLKDKLNLNVWFVFDCLAWRVYDGLGSLLPSTIHWCSSLT